MPNSGGPSTNESDSLDPSGVDVTSPLSPRPLERAQLIDLVRRAKAEPRRDGRAINVPFPPEVRAAVEAEWRAGIRAVSAIASDFGLSREVIYRWARQEGWPTRRSAMQAARERIDAAIIERAVAQARGVSNPSPGAGDARPGDADLEDARSDLTFETYAAVVAEVVERQRFTATQAVDLGMALLRLQEAAIALEKPAEAPSGGAAPRSLQTLIAGYGSLVRGLATAVALQRRSFGLDSEDESAQSSFQQGSYDDVVREAEARGELIT